MNGAKFFSNSLVVAVNCTDSPTCDETIGETPLNCPDKCGGSANVTPPMAPDLVYIPTEEYIMPSDPQGIPPSESEINEKTGQMVLVGVVILAVVAALAYFFYFRKK